jgi:hypothetical protein
MSLTLYSAETVWVLNLPYKHTSCLILMQGSRVESVAGSLGYSAEEHGELLSSISATLNSVNAIESSLAVYQKILGVYQQTGFGPLAIYHLARQFLT